MPVFEHRFSVAAAVERVAAFHYAAEAFSRLIPPGMILRIHQQDALANDSVNEFTMWMGPIPVYWKAVHSDVSDSGFVDTQTAGPMAAWVHTHSFEAVSADECVVIDHIEYEHHKGWRGIRSRLLFARMGLRVLFAWRALATRRSVRSTA